MQSNNDAWARQQIGKLWGAHRELASDYWGPDRNNGRRSEIRDMDARLSALEVARIENGAAAKSEAGKSQLTLARLQMRTAITVGAIAALPGLIAATFQIVQAVTK